MAQSSVGSVFGKADAGTAISIENLDTGTKREITAGSDGRYTFNQLPTGRYKVSSPSGSREVTVKVGTGTNVDLAAATGGDAKTLDAIQVTGQVINPIDVSSVESTTIFTASQLEKLPIGRDITSVALLAPGTVKGDSGFGNLASIGGSSVAENGYYINGFDVTNSRNFLSYANLPFGAIGEQQIKTGGYGAEFGRSLGGVLNVVTKRGTNEWKFGGAAFWDPASLDGTPKNVLDRNYPDDSANRYLAYRSANESNNASLELYAGGPIIKDRLFVFGEIEVPYSDWDNYGKETSSRNWSNKPKGMVKVDWNITDNHLLEFTGISQKYKEFHQNYHNYENPAGDEDHPYYEYTGKHGEHLRYTSNYGGSEVYILRYTGYLTDNFTLSALAGKLDSTNDFNPSDAGSWPGSDCPRVWDGSASWATLVHRGCWDENRAVSLRTPNFGPNKDDRESYRIDADWQVGDHRLRFGYDSATFTSSQAGSEFIGGGIYYRYGIDGNGFNVPTLATGTPFVRTWEQTTSAGEYELLNTALYIEDSWQVTENLLLYGGVRQETFQNKNALGEIFIENKDLIGPRLGFSWDVKGDSSLKVFANAGRYFIPVANNTNVRASRIEFFDTSYWTYTGVDPTTGAAQGMQLVWGPFINGGREPPNPATLSDTKLEPMHQDEYILGAQWKLGSDWSMGVRAIHRKLQKGMEDYCSHNALEQWALDEGYATGWTGENDGTGWTHDSEGIDPASCYLINPGFDVTLQMDPDNDGDLETLTVPASYFGLPKLQRSYNAIEFLFEKSFSNNWALQGSYTWAQSKGNSEGYVNSTLEQVDAGLTQDFDNGLFEKGAYGYLPNDRRHTVKMFGTYQFNDEWSVGGNFLAQSGRPVNCQGPVPYDTLPFPDQGSLVAYGWSSFYCTGQDGNISLSKRGEFGRTPWTYRFDASVTYTPNWADKKLSLGLDVFNLFDLQPVTEYTETSAVSEPDRYNRNFGQDLNFQSPRSVRLSARYEW